MKRQAQPDGAMLSERGVRRLIPLAIEHLATRSVRGFRVGRSGTQLAWLDDGDVRTLRIGIVSTEPLVVRLFVDHFWFFVSTRVAKSLGVAGGNYAQACPTRPCAEISVLPDEVEAALGWALAHDARTGDVPQPPFEAATRDRWTYVLSTRTADCFAERERARRRSHPLAAGEHVQLREWKAGSTDLQRSPNTNASSFGRESRSARLQHTIGRD